MQVFTPGTRGLAAFVFGDLRQAGRMVPATEAASADGRWQQRTHIDDDVVLVVAGAPAGDTLSGSFAQLSHAPPFVVAAEGYIVNLREVAALSGAVAGSLRGAVLADLVGDQGPPVLTRLNGAFTLVVWNARSRTALVHACKWGQRNLYLRTAGAATTVASDLAALRRLSGRAFDADARRLGLLAVRGSLPGSRTVLPGVTRVVPGSTVTLTPGGSIHQPMLPPTLLEDVDGRPTAYHAERLDAALGQAMRRFANVASTQAVMVGSGVDSSLVAAYARRAIPSLTAVTQRMPADLDESPQARRVMSALEIPHAIVAYEPRGDTLVSEVAAFVRIAEEPAYWNQLGPPLLQLLTRLPAHPHAFLTGAEGDLLFNFRRPGGVSLRRLTHHRLLWPVFRHTARRLVNRVTRHTYIVGTDFDLLDRAWLRQHLDGAATVPFDEHEGDQPAAPPPGSPEDVLRHFRDNGWQNVRIICQLAASVGSEACLPYLDDDVLACVLALPNELKINKALLRLLLGRFLPRRIVPTSKRGYWAHTVAWHAAVNGLHEACGLLEERRTLERGLYNARTVRQLVETYRRQAATPRDHPVFWQLLLLESFCREFVDRSVG